MKAGELCTHSTSERTGKVEDSRRAWGSWWPERGQRGQPSGAPAWAPGRAVWFQQAALLPCNCGQAFQRQIASASQVALGKSHPCPGPQFLQLEEKGWIHDLSAL